MKVSRTVVTREPRGGSPASRLRHPLVVLRQPPMHWGGQRRDGGSLGRLTVQAIFLSRSAWPRPAIGTHGGSGAPTGEASPPDGEASPGECPVASARGAAAR